MLPGKSMTDPENETGPLFLVACSHLPESLPVNFLPSGSVFSQEANPAVYRALSMNQLALPTYKAKANKGEGKVGAPPLSKVLDRRAETASP
eukprot:1150739-Pelagomonas_calceolata.AAC.1